MKSRVLQDWKMELQKSGWVKLYFSLERELSEGIFKIANALGIPYAGRKGAYLERLSPTSADQSYPQSLSRKYGLEALPLHNDTAHFPTPCRYVVLGCEEPGEVPSPTVLLDSKSLQLTKFELSRIYSTPFFIMNGRRSFYSSIRSKSRKFVRFDPGCMHPVSEEGREAMNIFGKDRNKKSLVYICWTKNSILVIDNWRVLHGRENSQPADQHRSLLRVTIK